MKIVLNECHGGFGLSDKAMQLYLIRAKVTDEELQSRDIPRADPTLVQIVEELGAEANGRFAQLAVLEIPDGTPYEIGEYDGVETAYVGCTSLVSANSIFH